MTADGTGVRQALISAHEMRRLAEYPRPSSLSEEELLQGYRVRLDMLRDGLDAPACPYKTKTRPCPCHPAPR